ncbi:MAG: proton-conducting transporter membrane subunit [Desulfarculaceae bacterium]|jgi:multicomponent Na+:H+ antiporter subunit D
MNEQLPALLIIAPLLTALLVSLAGWIEKRLCFPLAVTGLSVTALSSLGLLTRVAMQGPVDYRLGGWPPPIGIIYYVDGLSALVACAVAVLALVNLVATWVPVKKDFADRRGAFYTLYILAVTGLLGMVVTGDAFNLYVLLEIASLTGYALIGLGTGRAALSSLNYVLLGTIGACFYLLGVGYLYIVTGSLNMADIARLLPPLYESKAVLAAFVIALVGLMFKMAFFPLHAWLPNAYTHANSAASSLLAPLMTKVMIYVMIRVIISIFTPAYVFSVLNIGPFLVWMATAAIVAGALMALAQSDLKRMLTYIIVAEVGYMVGGAWLGNRLAMTGAVLHIVNDALMTLGVFLVAGNLFHKLRGLSFDDLKGLFSRMPYSMGALVFCGLAIIGVPPTCGFFSKWYLLYGAWQAGSYFFMGALLFSSLVNVVLFFRVFEKAFFAPQGRKRHGQAKPESAAVMDEAPLTMLAPALLVAAGLVVLGLYTGPIVAKIILPALPAGLG